mmetsp:Transcript_37320/g.87052  ORF Transcript_37320/g.87052 Transcript_37320/m.87052 type:complete len:106 (+) Transcript_37320:383-700(+)
MGSLVDHCPMLFKAALWQNSRQRHSTRVANLVVQKKQLVEGPALGQHLGQRRHPSGRNLVLVTPAKSYWRFSSASLLPFSITGKSACQSHHHSIAKAVPNYPSVA